MSTRERNESLVGLAYGIAAYVMWGLGPLFWRQLAGIGAAELLAHRLVWGWVCFVVLLVVGHGFPEFRRIARSPALRRRLALSAVLLATNWFVFVYAVLTERVLDASLGYFINPIVSVALGRIVLGERMRPLQRLAVLVAAVGIAVATWLASGLPWIAVVLALSFAVYGLLRKTTDVEPLAGSAFETTLLLPLGAVYVAWQANTGDGQLGQASAGVHGLLVATGLVTALPLLAFVNAAIRVRLSTVGFLQYLAPTLQFIVAVAVFGEPVASARLSAFGFVWAALVVFAVDAWRSRPHKTAN